MDKYFDMLLEVRIKCQVLKMKIFFYKTSHRNANIRSQNIICYMGDINFTA